MSSHDASLLIMKLCVRRFQSPCILSVSLLTDINLKSDGVHLQDKLLTLRWFDFSRHIGTRNRLAVRELSGDQNQDDFPNHARSVTLHQLMMGLAAHVPRGASSLSRVVCNAETVALHRRVRRDSCFCGTAEAGPTHFLSDADRNVRATRAPSSKRIEFVKLAKAADLRYRKKSRRN
jgi:hypothetical protein